MSNPSKLFLGGELSPGTQRRFLILVCFVMSAAAWVSVIVFVREAFDDYVDRRVEAALVLYEGVHDWESDVRGQQCDRTITDIMGRLVSVERALSKGAHDPAQ